MPGTAGFVTWYLRNLPSDDVAESGELSRTAAGLSQSYRAESDALWTALENRRLPNGELRAWERPTVRAHLESWHADARASERWFDRLGGYLLAPSLAVLSIAGQ